MINSVSSWSLPVQSLAHVVLEVADLERARSFYSERLGIGPRPIEGWHEADEIALPCLSGQHLVLRKSAVPRTFKDTGVHQAYRAGPAAIERIVQSLAADAITVHRYHEDRPAEQNDACYFTDPDGNRIQLVRKETTVGPGIVGIDHAAIQASDMEWEEELYGDLLGLKVDHRVGLNTGDYVRARLWGDGKEDMAPGTRRWDERYRDIPGAKPGQGRRTPRPNMQIFFKMGEAILGVYMATAHEQEPPPRQAKGTPRTAYVASREALDKTAAVLENTRVAALGPIEHAAKSPIVASLYFRDPCGNFIELCSPRQA